MKKATPAQKYFVKNLKALAKQLALNHTDLGSLVGSNRRAVGEWLTGKALPSEQSMNTAKDKITAEYEECCIFTAALETFLAHHLEDNA